MLAYADGTEAHIGDHVDFDGTPAVVIAVIDNAELRKQWFNEDGVMCNLAPGGLVFEASDSSCWDSIVFLKRAGA